MEIAAKAVLQVGCFGTDNLGDEMGAREIRRQLRARFSGASLQFAMVTRDPTHSARTHPDVTAFFTEDALARGDVPLGDFALIVLGPGTLLGEKMIRSARFLLRHLRGQAPRLFIWACGVDPIRPGRSPRELVRLCSLAQRITVRNQRCAQYLANAGIADRVHATADPLFAAQALPRKPSGATAVTVTISETMLRLGPLLRRSLMQSLADAMQRYCSETRARLYFLPMRIIGHKRWRSDLEWAEALSRALPREIRLITDNSEGALLEYLSAADLYIGTRLHGCLLAAVAGCRVLGIGWSEKMVQLFNDLELPDALLPPRQAADPALLHQAMRSARPADRQTIAHLRIRAQSTAHLVSL
jgi:polysaccharide pyruvyl transferase WcaK-like protein